ncbi:MAG: hypothetical protein ACKV2U_16260 [Bryobacteraceae bacterium]
MKITFLVLAIGAMSSSLMAADEPAIAKIEIVCAAGAACTAVTPGTKIKATVAADAAADTPMALYVDGKPVAVPEGSLKKGTREITFDIDKKIAVGLTALFTPAGLRSVSIGPPPGKPFANAQNLRFEPLEPPGVSGYSVDRWKEKGSNCFEEVKNSSPLPEDCWARLGDRIELKIADQAMATFKPTDEIVMWIDGGPMPGLKGRNTGSSGGLTTLVFHWDENLPSQKDSKESWLRVLRNPSDKRSSTISAGTVAGPPLPSGVREFHIRRLSEKGLIVWGGFFLVAVGTTLYLALKKDLLREDEGLVAAQGRRAYSLARTQMAAWTFLVAMALSYVWMVTWNEDVVNGQVLVLMGIATGTLLGAVVVDDSKKEEAAKLLAAASGTAPAVVPVNPPAIANAQAVLTTPPNEWFLMDLISDRNGPSIARVQMLLFSLILMVIFVVETTRTLVMPQFSDTLLGLMGISSGGYLALKVPERKM